MTSHIYHSSIFLLDNPLSFFPPTCPPVSVDVTNHSNPSAHVRIFHWNIQNYFISKPVYLSIIITFYLKFWWDCLYNYKSGRKIKRHFNVCTGGKVSNDVWAYLGHNYDNEIKVISINVLLVQIYAPNEDHHHHHLRFTSIFIFVHTKARVRRYQQLCWFWFWLWPLAIDIQSRMPFQLRCVLLFGSVVDSARIQNH